VAKTYDTRDGRSPSPSSTRTPERLEPEPDSSSTGRGNTGSRYVAVAELQRLAGNRATSRLIGTSAVQRDAAVAAPGAPPGGGPASPGTAGAPGPEGAAAPPSGKEHRILDRATNAPIVVDEARWKDEGQHLVKRVKSALKLIPEDSKEVLDEYPLAEVRDMYAACMDAVKDAIEALRMGALVEASKQMHNADQWTGIEIKAHKLLMEMGVLKYVGGQLDHAVIGFFQGAADSLLGLVDGAASLFDADTGLVAWNDKQYHQIQEAYTGVSGIDIDHVMAGSIGKMGGQLAEGLATFETLGGAGNTGKVVMGVEAAAGVKSVGEKIVKMRADGKSWSAIFGDPAFLAECAGAIAGAAGAGASFAGPLNAFLKEAGMIASEAQIAATVDAIVDIQLDKSLTAQARNERTVQLLGQGLQTLAAVADGAARGGGPELPGGAEASGGGERADPTGGAGRDDAVPHPIAPASEPTVSVPVRNDGVPTEIGPGGDSEYHGPAPSDGVPVAIPGHEPTERAPASPNEKTEKVERPGEPGPPKSATSDRESSGEEPTQSDEQPLFLDERDFDEIAIDLVPAESVMSPGRPKSGSEARTMYRNSIAESPGREAAIYRNTVTGEYIVVQGEETTAAVAPGEAPRSAGKVQRWKEILDADSDVGSWELQAHSHPPESSGVVHPSNRYPSGGSGDMGAMFAESRAAGHARSSRIDYMLEDGPGHTDFGFNPGESSPYWVDVAGMPGMPRRFETMEAYHVFLENDLGVDPGAVPESMSGKQATEPVAPNAARRDRSGGDDWDGGGDEREAGPAGRRPGRSGGEQKEPEQEAEAPTSPLEPDEEQSASIDDPGRTPLTSETAFEEVMRRRSGPLAGEPWASIEADDIAVTGFEKEGSDREGQTRRVLVLRVASGPHKGLQVRLSVAWDSESGTYEDIHEASR
jgi:hypothetical protein